MKLKWDLNEHGAVRGAVKLLSGIVRPKAVDATIGARIGTVAGTIDAAARAPRATFREQFYDEVLKHAERLQPLAAPAAKSFLDPLASADALAYGLALRVAANKFAFVHELAPELFLTESEQRLCEAAVLLNSVVADIRECVERSASEIKLDAGAERTSTRTEMVFQALRVLALYRQTSAEQRDPLFDLLELRPESQIEIVTKLVEYMEDGFSRAESLEWLRRHGAPAWLAQRAVAARVAAEMGIPSEAGAASFARTLDRLHLKDETIIGAWTDAGFELSLIEHALANL
jgi:hypothetical protein